MQTSMRRAQNPYGGPVTTQTDPATLTDLLRLAVQRDGARPFITYYDDATGERTELSLTTFQNWVAKTSNYLRDELDLGSGSAVGVALPLHWLTAVWLSACWSVGAVPVIDPADDEVLDAAVIGPRRVEHDHGLLPMANDVVAVSLAPLAASFGRLGVALPDGVRDYTDEVRVHGDQFDASALPSPDDPALCVMDRTWTHNELVHAVTALTTRFGIDQHARLMTTQGLDGLDPIDAILAAFVTPLVVDGSVVMCVNADPSGLTERADAEHVTAWAQPPSVPAP